MSTWLLAHRKQINKFKHPTSLGGGVDLHTVGLSECVLKSVFRFPDKCVDYFMVRDELCQMGECSKNKSLVAFPQALTSTRAGTFAAIRKPLPLT